MKKVLGILVTYNPDLPEVKKNLQIIARQVDFLVIIDNASKNQNLLQTLITADNTEIISNKENIGLGAAYNIALRKYHKDYKYFITFDQDTQIPPNTVGKLKAILEEDASIGVVGPAFSRDIANITQGQLISKDVIIQSCALFPMSVYNRIGGFNEAFFIDSVDFEYCLRIRKAGYKVKIYNGVNIYHELGTIVKFGNKSIMVHNNIRNYYMARNHFQLLKKFALRFPFFSAKLHFFFLKHLYEVAFIEKNKEKMSYIKKGILNQKI